jgi:hypothetical protein
MLQSLLQISLELKKNVHGEAHANNETLQLQLAAHYNEILSTLSGVSSVDTLASNYPINHSGCTPRPHIPRFTLPHIASDLPTSHIIPFFSEKIS